MTAPREDSVLTSIREIQRMEEERLRENARRAEAAERERVARAEAARQEAEREATARAERLETERREEQRVRDEAERKAREAQEARELAIRMEADAERQLRAQRLADEHAQAMAAIEADRARGVQAPKVVAMVFVAVALTGVAGWFGVYVPHQRQHAATLSSIEARAQMAQRERDQRLREADVLAARLRVAPPASAPTPAAVVAPTPAPRVAQRTQRVRVQQRQTETPEVIDLDGRDNDPFAMDDGARRGNGRPPRR